MPDLSPTETLTAAATRLRRIAAENEWRGVTSPIDPMLAPFIADWLEAVVGEMTGVAGTKYAYEEYASWTAAFVVAQQLLGAES